MNFTDKNFTAIKNKSKMDATGSSEKKGEPKSHRVVIMKCFCECIKITGKHEISLLKTASTVNENRNTSVNREVSD